MPYASVLSPLPSPPKSPPGANSLQINVPGLQWLCLANVDNMSGRLDDDDWDQYFEEYSQVIRVALDHLGASLRGLELRHLNFVMTEQAFGRVIQLPELKHFAFGDLISSGDEVLNSVMHKMSNLRSLRV